MPINQLKPEDYHQAKDYLSNSSLSNFVSFDFFGNPTYNIHEFINPTQPSNDAITVGSIVDRILTEWFNIDDEYWPKLLKDDMMSELDMMWVSYDKKTTVAVLEKLLEMNGYIFKKELGKVERDAINTIMQRSKEFVYDKDLQLAEYLKDCDMQMVITNDDWGMRGKFDLISHKYQRISDLKTTGNLERFMKELVYQGKPNIYHKYVRQLAIYQELYFRESGKRYDTELIIIDWKGKHTVFRVGQWALDRALAQVYKDIDVLRAMYNNETPFIKVYDILPDEEVFNVDVPEESEYLTQFD